MISVISQRLDIARYRRNCKTVKISPTTPEISSMPTGVRGYVTCGTAN